MGQISRKFIVRLQATRKLIDPLRQEAAKLVASDQIPRDVRSIEECVRSGMDPLHAAYVSTQNFVSLFAEAASQFDEFDPFAKLVAEAEDEYVPSSPPISPITVSYFTTWVFFDVRFGPDLETIGTCLLDVESALDLDKAMLEIVREFQESRMGIYEHLGTRGGRCMLKELITGREFTSYVAAGYAGKKGELWYVRLCPPLFDLFDYHLVFTTPYVLMESKEAWTAYLKKSILGAGDQAQALRSFLKFGPHPNHWNEFIFQAYHHHSPEVIYLAGLPDVKASRPHGDLSREP